MSIDATEALHDEPDLVICLSPGFGIVGSAIVDRSFTNLRGQENLIVPDDRRRGAAPSQGNLPNHVFAGTPAAGQMTTHP